MKKISIMVSLALIGAMSHMQAYDLHHIWNRTGETILVAFVYGSPGVCAEKAYALIHHTPVGIFGTRDPQHPDPSWAQTIEQSSAGVNCPLQKVEVWGMTGKIKNKANYLMVPGSGEAHFVIDRDGDKIQISRSDLDLREIYKKTPQLIPELTLQRNDDDIEKATGQKWSYTWNHSLIMENNIKKELKKVEKQASELPDAHRTRVLNMVEEAKKERDKLLNLYKPYMK
jgi:hypothetical protein